MILVLLFCPLFGFCEEPDLLKLPPGKREAFARKGVGNIFRKMAAGELTAAEAEKALGDSMVGLAANQSRGLELVKKMTKRYSESAAESKKTMAALKDAISVIEKLKAMLKMSEAEVARLKAGR